MYFLSFVSGYPSLNNLQNWKTWRFQGSSRSCHLSSCLVKLLAAILRIRTQERACGPKGTTRTKNFELCQTRVEGKNESRLHICLRFLLPKSYRNKTINKYFVFHIRPWFATNTKQRYLYSCQTRRATSFQSCPPGDTCSTCMSIPTPYLRGVLFIFAEYIWSYVVRTYTCIHISKQSAES